MEIFDPGTVKVLLRYLFGEHGIIDAISAVLPDPYDREVSPEHDS